MWPQMRQWCRRFTTVNARSHLLQLRLALSSAQWPDTVSWRGMMLDGDQLLDVVDTDENEWCRDWRSLPGGIFIMGGAALGRRSVGRADELPALAGRTHMEGCGVGSAWIRHEEGFVSEWFIHNRENEDGFAYQQAQHAHITTYWYAVWGWRELQVIARTTRCSRGAGRSTAMQRRNIAECGEEKPAPCEIARPNTRAY